MKRTIDIDKLRDQSPHIPLPMYCTSIQDGRFLVTTPDLAIFLGYTEVELRDESFSAERLHVDEQSRLKWLQRLKEKPDEFYSCSIDYLIRRPTDSDARRVSTIDTARIWDTTEGECIIGVLGLFDDSHLLTLASSRIDGYRKVLELIDTGFHESDSNGRIQYMNRHARHLLQLSESEARTLRAADLHQTEVEARQVRYKSKIREGDGLNEGQHFVYSSSPGKREASAGIGGIPVNIHEIAIPSPTKENGQNHEIFSVVRDERIPHDITEILRKFGPRNPILTEIGIASFIAVRRDKATEFDIPAATVEDGGDDNGLVFVYANARFVDELRDLTRSHSEIGVKELSDVLGKTQSQLWSHKHINGFDFGTTYAFVDQMVVRNGVEDQRIEKHPRSGWPRSTDVQVFKIPYRDSSTNEVIGVVGFYWDLGNSGGKDLHSKIRNGFSRYYDSFRILDNIPLPVYMKDQQLRFVYANQAYLNDIRSVSRKFGCSVNSLHDLIGLTDRDLFPEYQAHEYEADDADIIVSKVGEIEKDELHAGRLVRVKKRPVFSDNRVIGVQGVFWYFNPGDGLISFDWRSKETPICLVNGAKVEIERNKTWYFLDCLVRNTGRYVTYKQIGDFTEGLATPDAMQKAKQRLAKLIRQEVLPLCNGQWNVSIEPHPDGNAYRLHIEMVDV